jgi:hypothetical protein
MEGVLRSLGRRTTIGFHRRPRLYAQQERKHTCTRISSWLTPSQSLSMLILFGSGLKRLLRTAGRHRFLTFMPRDLTRASVLSTTQTDWILAVLTYRLSNVTPRLPLRCLGRLWMKSFRSIARTFSCCNIRCGGICRPQFLKGWFDRVFAYGEVYASQRRFEKGRYAGKRAMLSVTVGTGRETYMYDGRSGDIDLMLWP